MGDVIDGGGEGGLEALRGRALGDVGGDALRGEWRRGRVGYFEHVAAGGWGHGDGRVRFLGERLACLNEKHEDGHAARESHVLAAADGAPGMAGLNLDGALELVRERRAGSGRRTFLGAFGG